MYPTAQPPVLQHLVWLLTATLEPSFLLSWVGLIITFQWIVVHFQKCTWTPSRAKLYVAYSWRLAVFYTTLTETSNIGGLQITFKWIVVHFQKSTWTPSWAKLYVACSWRHVVFYTTLAKTLRCILMKNCCVLHPDIDLQYSLIPYCGLDTVRKLNFTCSWVYVNA